MPVVRSGLLCGSLGVASLFLPFVAVVSSGLYAQDVVEAPAFTSDVAPIVLFRCAPCHRDGGAAPFALGSYDEVATRARAIAEVIRTGFMPPWLPEEGGETFSGARRLNASERDTILRWIDQGARRGDATASHQTQIGAKPAFRAHSGETSREHDPEVSVSEPYTLAASGPDVFRNFVLRVPLGRARFVRAVAIDPGASGVVHHASLGLDTTRTARRLDTLDEEGGFAGMLSGAAQSPPGHFVGWAPGKPLHISPLGLSWRLSAGADIVLQVHMVPSGKSEVVRPSVAFNFTDEPPEDRAVLVRLGSTNIDIPAAARLHEVEDTFELPVGVELLGVMPHAHYRARHIESVATLPDGRRVPLITIKAWNFRWQDEYRYATPLRLPASTKITTRAVFDNSTENPANPHHPPRRAVYGPSTDDEMGDVWLQVVPGSALDAARLTRVLARREIEAQSSGYRRLASSSPDEPAPRLTLASLYLQAGRLVEAKTELDRVLSSAPSLTLALYTRGVVLHRAGRLEEAARDFRNVLTRDPAYAEAEHGLGHVRLNERRMREAEQHFVRAVTLWPEFADGWSSLATLRASAGHQEGAVQAYRRALVASPDHREALNNLGILLARRGSILEAIALLERAVDAHPDDEASTQNLAAARALQQ